MERASEGLLDPDNMHEVSVDPASSPHDAMTEVEQEELREELNKLEEEVATLRQVLGAKELHMAEIKRKLGVGPIGELRQNLTKGWQDMQSSNAYKKTQETLSQAGQKTTAAIGTVSSAISRKLGDMKNSPTFKSFEERVESTVYNIKSKVVAPGPTGGTFEEVLNSTANASRESGGGN
uniref:tumor protein D52-like isoform X2 n=1 Tax=Myxine glutinosa TaxID=7769 RepID=UPI00358DE11C